MNSVAATSPGQNGKDLIVDPFLVEALQNPRHRLTILRMELDIQKFLHDAGKQQFEFQHFPTSYLRLAAHRVAQHYGMQTMVQDSGLDNVGNRILVRKTAESIYPSVRLSEIPAKQSDNDKPEHMTIVMRRRLSKVSENEANESGIRPPLRSVEERKEEYDKARARIFSTPSSPEFGNPLSRGPSEEKNIPLNTDRNERSKITTIDAERNISYTDVATFSRVAIFRDREKDLTDPDYDRSYKRYARSLPRNQSFSSGAFNFHKGQVPFMQYDNVLPPLSQMTRSQASLSYRPPSNAVVDPFCAMGLSQLSRDATDMQWPSSAMMYAHSREQFRDGVLLVPFYQQPLSFSYWQNQRKRVMTSPVHISYNF